MGDDAVYPASEQAEKSAHRAPGRRLACRRIDRGHRISPAFTRQAAAAGADACESACTLNGPIVLHPSQCNLGLDWSKMIRYITRCKENIALGAIMSKFEYLKLADTVATEIANGALKPGD